MAKDNAKRTYLRDGRAPVPNKELTSRTMSAIKAKNTKPELILRKALWAAGVKGYRLHWKKASGRPDIAFPGRRLAIFVNGCYWHRCPHCQPSMPKTHTDFWEAKFARNTERDARKVSELKAAGWQVLIIWECQIKNELGVCVKRVLDVL